jgi:hypothetical protein
MATADAKDQATAPLLPPDEKFWTRYSPHFELPLAGAASLLVHGVILGVLTLGGLALLLRGSIEASKPPSIDVVMVQGTEGDGQEEGGGTPGGPGPDDGMPRTDAITQESPSVTSPRPVSSATVPVPSVPMVDLGPAPTEDVEGELAKIAAAADAQVKAEMNLPPQKPAAVTKTATPKSAAGPPGTGNRKGTNGLGTRGTGTGSGDKTGPGIGRGGLPGKMATQQEIFAQRWRFDLTGGGKDHADKLASIGVTLAMPDPTGGFLVVTDLTRRPVELRKDKLQAYQDAVKWYNIRPESIRALAQELRLPFAPQFVVLLLPKDREEKMAAEEARFAREHGRDVRRVRETWFDFRRQLDGQYEPTAIRQQ